MFFGCPARGEKNDFKSYNNGDSAVIIPYRVPTPWLFLSSDDFF